MKTVIKNISVTLNIPSLAGKLKIAKTSDQYALLEKLGKEALSSANPGYMFTQEKVLSIENNRIELRHISLEIPGVVEFLSPGEGVFPFIATAGKETDQWLKIHDSVLTQYLKEEIASAILEQTIEKMKQKIIQINESEHIAIVSPGSLSTWPLEAQKDFKTLFKDSLEKLHITFTEHHTMVPRHSLSGICFACADQQGFCTFCSNRSCKNRTAPLHDRLE